MVLESNVQRPASSQLHRNMSVLRKFVSLLTCLSLGSKLTTQNMTTSSDGQFLYFAYGSNLLRQRLQYNNPSASFHSIGRLKDYELKFGLWSKNVSTRWHGAVATIDHSPGAEVWGVIWTMSNQHLSSLDAQEGVSSGIYSPLEVSVETKEGMLLCRTYKMNNFTQGLPSPQYKKVVCLGAEENGLPAEYLSKLNSIETNGYDGPTLLDKLNL